MTATWQCDEWRVRRTFVATIIGFAACKSATNDPIPPPSLMPEPLAVAAVRHPHPDAGGEPAGRSAFYAQTFSKRPSVPDMTALGALVFRDPSLSASGHLACATCHDPDHAFAPAAATAVQRGGPNDKLAGVRAAPSLRYLQTVPRFTQHFHDSDGDDGIDQGPAGGLTWDGRAQSTHDQARSPLMSPLEMANTSIDELAGKLRKAPYAAQFRTTFGEDVLETSASALKAATLALEVYQQDPATFYPYTSKYDRVLAGTETLDPAEARGLALFEDTRRANCATCHPDRIKGGLPAFTDFGFVALGVPRNREIPANADPNYFDLGLCGPYRTDLAKHPEYCGMFRTPSLRNVALRKRYFHNGVFKTLDQVVRFYATRDTSPDRWYPRGAPFDDLPARYHANINREPPFGGKPGDKPRLTDAEISDLVAFLNTLTDRAASK